METNQKISQDLRVGLLMGSDSDWPIMREAAIFLQDLGIAYEADVVSAHRTPQKLWDYALGARARGLRVLVAGAGGAAHLPGMLASMTPLPVIGVPIKSRNSIDGWDSVLSILQMPAGVPVATVALNGGLNAGILAAQILASAEPELLDRLAAYKESLAQKVLAKSQAGLKL